MAAPYAVVVGALLGMVMANRLQKWSALKGYGNLVVLAIGVVKSLSSPSCRHDTPWLHRAAYKAGTLCKDDIEVGYCLSVARMIVNDPAVP